MCDVMQHRIFCRKPNRPTASPSPAEGSGGGQPGQEHLAHGDGEEGGMGWIVCPVGEGEERKLGRHERALGSALVELVGRPLAFLWKLSIIKT